MIGILIIIIILVSLGRFLAVALKALFYVLIVAFVLILVLGISYTELLNVVMNIVLWVF